MAELRSGLHGGVDLLEKEDRVSSNSEANEPKNERQPDLLDKALSDVLGAFVGGHIKDQQYEIPVAGCEAPEYLEFDRFYFGHKLLVDLHQKPMNDADKAEIEAEIATKYAFTKQRDMRYLPVIGGVIAPSDLGAVFA